MPRSGGGVGARPRIAPAILAVLVFVSVAARWAPAEASPPRFRHVRATLRIVGRVPTGPQPKSVTVSPDGREVWVAAFGKRDVANLDVFDAATLTRRATIGIRGNPVEILFDRSGRRAFVSSFAAAKVMEVDVRTRAVLRELPAGLDPKTLALSPDESTLYVVNWRSNDVSVVDLATGSERFRLETSRHPRGIAVLPDGRVLVASTEGDSVHEFDAEGHPLRRLETCEFPRHLVLSADASHLYVTCSGESVVATYRLADFRRVSSAPTGRNPRSMALATSGRSLYVANYDGRSVSVVDLDGLVTASLEPPDVGRIVGIASRPGGGERFFATSWDTRELLAFEPRPAPERAPTNVPRGGASTP